MGGNGSPCFVHDILEQAAIRQPDAVAVRDIEGAWTYAELSRCSREYAAGLTAIGVQSGDRVLIRAVAERWVLAAVYACSRIGAIAVPLSPELRPGQWERIVADAEPAAVLREPPDVTAQAPVSTDGAGPGSPILFLYTSGSTGDPKAVMCPHRAVVFAARAIEARLGYRADDVILCRLPLSFDYGLYQTFLAAMAGAELVLRDARHDGGLMATIRQYDVTVVPLVPSLATMLIQLGKRGIAPSVRLVTNTGQELPPVQIDGLRRIFPACSVQLMYGTTECKRVTIAEPDADLVRPGSVGTALPGTSVRIVDSAGRRVAPGVEGQIVVSGPHLMSGYWKDDALTAQTYRPDPELGVSLLYTGDYGHLDHEGHLYFHGRRDHLFKLRGIRTSVAEIEDATRRVPHVTDAAVIPPQHGRDAVLFVVSPLDGGEVLRRLRDRLEPGKVPAICRVLPSLPLGSTGKVDRSALRRLADDSWATSGGN